MQNLGIARWTHMLVGVSSMVLLLGAGCGGGGDGGPDVVANHPISGQLAPIRTWTYMTGRAQLSTDSALYFITLYTASFDPCVDMPPDTAADDDTVVIAVPPSVGTYYVGVTPNLAGFNGLDAIDAMTGVVVIDAITATTISGGANISGAPAYPDLHADGQFQATICP